MPRAYIQRFMVFTSSKPIKGLFIWVQFTTSLARLNGAPANFCLLTFQPGLHLIPTNQVHECKQPLNCNRPYCIILLYVMPDNFIPSMQDHVLAHHWVPLCPYCEPLNPPPPLPPPPPPLNIGPSVCKVVFIWRWTILYPSWHTLLCLHETFWGELACLLPGYLPMNLVNPIKLYVLFCYFI